MYYPHIKKYISLGDKKKIKIIVVDIQRHVNDRIKLFPGSRFISQSNNITRLSKSFDLVF